MRKIENHHLATSKSDNCFRQDSSIASKISEEEKKMRNRILHSSTLPPF